MNTQEIETAVLAALDAAGIVYAATHLGARGEWNDNGTKWDHDAWRVMFSRAGTSAAFDYSTGSGHRQRKAGKPNKAPSYYSQRDWDAATLRAVAPEAAAVLHCLILDSSAAHETFTSWCSDLDYNDDSRKARAMYEACQQTADKLARIVPRDTLATIETLLQDY